MPKNHFHVLPEEQNNVHPTHPHNFCRPKKRRCKKLLMNSLSEADWLSESHSLSEAASSLSGWETLEEDKSEIHALDT
ncbi:hypothetical protein glysoja_044093 [Glycine soja]|uniref:Uncharacterized protein n=1 Tax=Glycine soja TaxID=3848 RepID=A0A0B2NQG3_GLYSO|nr:hypothetical protein glysoja_044093 [Glycine soja]